MEYLWLALGLILLFGGGDLLVKGSIALALRMKVSPLVIGLTVMSSATSAPELLVSLQAAIQGHPDIALGNIIGSNIANLGLILGLVSLFYNIPAFVKVYLFDWIVMLVATLTLYIILKSNNQIGFLGGLILVLALVAYNYYKIKNSRTETKIAELQDLDLPTKQTPLWKTLLYLAMGIVAMRFGANFFVEGASAIALTIGVSERVVSISIVAVGTSIPELIASLISAKKGEKDMAVGNLIGSNIFNILAVLGLTALITPIPMNDPKLLNIDYWWMLAYSFLLLPLMYLGRRNNFGYIEGGLFILAYFTYIFLQYS